ncbi:MAG: c-type cytochrome [Bdellovibrionaceae bacterium]|nr:c-type cytochrome [Pseudobdellovibrionaceae bacterium]
MSSLLSNNIFIVLVPYFALTSCLWSSPKASNTNAEEYSFEKKINELSSGPEKEYILYGKDLFDKTAQFIGPKGSKGNYTGNLMSCKNCHLESGSRQYGLPLYDSHGLYPQYRAREGNVLTLADRINSCIRMPMLGTNMPVDGREMQALLMYIRFLGTSRTILKSDNDQRLGPLPFLTRAASPEKGHSLFVKHCSRCHKEDGSGEKKPNMSEYSFPPVWGKESYRFGSSMHRVSILARFIKYNMPFDTALPSKPVLSDEEAWDISAYVNSEHLNPRPGPIAHLFAINDFKPFDYPAGPYADVFPPDRHKYGPYLEIIESRRNNVNIRKASDGDLNAP